MFSQTAAPTGSAHQWFATAAASVLIATALLYPKIPNERTAPTVSVPDTHALTRVPVSSMDVRLHPDAAPVFYSVCHRYQATPSEPKSYSIDYASCPVQRMQARATEHVALDLPADTASVLVEIWPLNRVEPARYIVATPEALRRDGLQLR